MLKTRLASVVYPVLLISTTLGWASNHTGLVVEGVDSQPSSSREIQEGDVIYGWRRDHDGSAQTKTDLDSPFDFWDLSEEAPEGKTKLTVRRGERELEVEVQPQQKIDVSPVFVGEQQVLYQKGRQSFASNNIKNGVDEFRALATCLFRDEDRERGAWILSEVGRHQANAEAWDEVAKTFKDASLKLGADPLVHAKILEVAGKLYEAHDKYREASDYFTRALRLRRQAEPDEYRPISSNYERLGRLAYLPGDFERAFNFYQDSLKLRDRFQPDVALSRLLNDMGKVALQSGNYPEAESLFKRAYDTAAKVDPGGSAYNDALQSLALLAAKYGQHAHARQYLDEVVRSELPAKQAARLGAEANTALEQGDETRALRLFKRAANVLEGEAGSELERAELLLHMGRLAAEQAQPEGENYLRDAYSITRRSAADQPLHAQVLYALGNLRRDQGRLNQAVSNYQAAREIIESREPLASGNAERGAFISAQQRRFYRDHIGTLIAAKRVEEAFEVSEHYRARTLLETLGRRGPDKRKQPTLPQPLNAAKAIAASEPDTCLISYLVLENTIQVFAVTDQGVKVYERKASDLATLISDFRRYMMSPDSPTAREKCYALSLRLSRMLLAPMAVELKSHKHLVIVPDGSLHALPFAALRQPSDAKSYMVQSHSITLADSATAYHLLHRDRDLRPKGLRWLGFSPPEVERRPARHEQAVLSDFEHYLETSSMRANATAALPFGAMEVEEIADFFEASSKALRGGQASENLVRELGTKADILHFACHGSFDAADPSASALLLAATPGAANADSDGRLTAREIAGLNLQASLVVLSACETGLGKAQGGEGSTNLARSFRYAGARSVVASLWRVSDLSTTVLMKSFYRNLLQSRGPSEALRRAQLDLIQSQGRSRDISHPFYWAAFQLIGTDVEESDHTLAKLKATKTKRSS